MTNMDTNTCHHEATRTGIDDFGIEWTFCYGCNSIIAEHTDDAMQYGKNLELRLAGMSVGEREAFNLADGPADSAGCVLA